MKTKKLVNLLRYHEDSVRIFKDASDPELLDGLNKHVVRLYELCGRNLQLNSELINIIVKQQLEIEKLGGTKR